MANAVAKLSNTGLAARARDLTAQAERGSMDRLAALCLSACLTTTTSPAAARKALAEIDSDAIRARARALLNELLANNGLQEPS